MFEHEKEVFIPQEIVNELTERSFSDEAAVIRSLSIGGDVSESISIINAVDFSDPKFRAIYETICELSVKNNTITMTAIVSHLEGNS